MKGLSVKPNLHTSCSKSYNVNNSVSVARLISGRLELGIYFCTYICAYVCMCWSRLEISINFGDVGIAILISGMYS